MRGQRFVLLHQLEEPSQPLLKGPTVNLHYHKETRVCKMEQSPWSRCSLSYKTCYVVLTRSHWFSKYFRPARHQPLVPALPDTHLQLHTPLHGHEWTGRRRRTRGGRGRGRDRRGAGWEFQQGKTQLFPTPTPVFAQAAPLRPGADPGLQHGGSGPLGHGLHG